MVRFLYIALALVLFAPSAHADKGVFDVCKGESKAIVAGTGQMSIAFIYPDDFPGRTTREVLFPIGERLAKAEKAKVILVADVDKALKLVKDKQWNDKATACTSAPGLAAVLGQKYPNLSSARVSLACDAQNKCVLRVDLERHGRTSADRWVRYEAPVADKTSTKAIAAAAPKLTAKGAPPDAPKAGLAVTELADGSVTTRSDADGALELDRAMEASSAIAACGPKNRKPHDIRGYWADWKLSALGTAMEVDIHPFAGKDPADQQAADCIKKAMQHLQMECPRDGKVTPVHTAICL